MESTRMEKAVLAVCADTSSQTCDCVYTTGWASPACFGESKSQLELEKNYNRTVTGLGVCFAIAVIYSVIITVFFARDCMKIIYKNQQKKLQQLKHQQRARDPYADSEKLTLDDDTASQPESGVWSQSEGSGGNRIYGNNGQVPGIGNGNGNHQNGRRKVKTQSHVNAAYSQDEVVQGDLGESNTDILPKYADVSVHAHEAPSSRGARPKVSPLAPSDDSHKPYPSSSYPQTTADYHGNTGGYSGQTLSAPSGEYEDHPGRSPSGYSNRELPSPRSPRLITPGREAYPRGKLPSEAPPSSVRSEGRAPRSPNNYTAESRGAYTDVPRDKQQGYHDNRGRGTYTEPRRLDFIQGNVNAPEPQGPYIDKHDTVI